jgi:hypothetical protein
MKDRLEELAKQREEIVAGGGEKRIAKQHEQGKLTARERIAALLDTGSFAETGMFARHRSTLFGMAEANLPADGVVTGSGTVLGRLVHLASQDFTVAGGSTGEVHNDKVVEMMKASLKRVLQQRRTQRRRAADHDHCRALCGRRRVLAGVDGLHHPDARRPDVHHRSQRHQAGHR